MSLTYTTAPHPEWHNCSLLQAACPICGKLVDAVSGKRDAEWAKAQSVANGMRGHMLDEHEMYGWEIEQPGAGAVDSTYLRYYRSARVLIVHAVDLFDVFTRDEMRIAMERRRTTIDEIEREIALLKEAFTYAN